MNVRTWKTVDGKFHYAVEFKKGTGALRLKEFETKADVNKAVKELIEYVGEDYSKHDLPWEITNRTSGEVSPLFRRITFDDAVAF